VSTFKIECHVFLPDQGYSRKSAEKNILIPRATVLATGKMKKKFFFSKRWNDFDLQGSHFGTHLLFEKWNQMNYTWWDAENRLCLALNNAKRRRVSKP
jgi:hypothetical protein